MGKKQQKSASKKHKKPTTKKAQGTPEAEPIINSADVEAPSSCSSVTMEASPALVEGSGTPPGPEAVKEQPEDKPKQSQAVTCWAEDDEHDAPIDFDDLVQFADRSYQLAPAPQKDAEVWQSRTAKRRRR